jgi:hypothetical protein
MQPIAGEVPKEKGRHGAALSRFKTQKARAYMPEPWTLFQLASIAFTALSGRGT